MAKSRNRTEIKDKKLSFRVPKNLFELYEEKCIEEHIRMSECFQTAFLNFLREKNKDNQRNLDLLPER